MLSYQVRLQTTPEQAARLEAYLRETHVPDVLATGCFLEARTERLEPTVYRNTYLAETRADLERYLEEHASRLRAEFALEFPAGVTLSREIWEEVERWTRPRRAAPP
jgi:hypothetical protein